MCMLTVHAWYCTLLQVHAAYTYQQSVLTFAQWSALTHNGVSGLTQEAKSSGQPPGRPLQPLPKERPIDSSTSNQPSEVPKQSYTH